MKILYDFTTIVITNVGKDLVLLTFWLLTLENVMTLWRFVNFELSVTCCLHSYYRYLPIVVVTITAAVLPNKRKGYK